MNSTYYTLVPGARSLVSCGEAPSRVYSFLDEATAWEAFDEPKLERYVAEGAAALAARIQKIADPVHALNESETKELFFMLESLLYAKDILCLQKEDAIDEESAQ